MIFYKHYITIDNDNRIIDGWSDGPHPEKDTADAICINEKGSYQVYLTVDGKRTEENPRWLTDDGIPIYKWDGEKVISRMMSEVVADRAAIPTPPPSEQEQLRADIDFLAAMQGVNL